MKGFADAVKDDIVYELKFVSELTHEHFLQCASYMVAMQKQKGILWNTRDNTSYEIEVPDRRAFLDAVTKAITKGAETYFESALRGEKPAAEVEVPGHIAETPKKKKGILSRLFGIRN